MFRTLTLAFLLAISAVLHAQQVLDLPAPNHSLEFKVNNMAGLNVYGVARGIPGLDYSAGVSVTSPESGPVLHRIIFDRTHHDFFGYDLTITRLEDGTHLHLHFAPLSDVRGFKFDHDLYHPAEMSVPPDSDVAAGTPTEVPLEIDAAGQTTLRDRVTVTLAP